MGVGIALANNPNSLQWSPFQENLLAVATSNRPGHTPISGIIYFLEFLPKNDIEIEHQVQLNIGTRLLAFSQKDANTVLCSCDDNVLRFFDLKNIDCMYKQWYETERINALDWDRISLEWILTGGSDNNVKLYNTLQDDDEAQLIFDNHESSVFDAQFNTHSPYTFTSCDRLGFVYLWDIRQRDPAMKFKMHNRTCAVKMDRNIFDENSLALAGFDNGIMTYDLRNISVPKSYIKDAHYHLMTKIKWSPHTQHILATSSCDRTLRIWDMRSQVEEKKPDKLSLEDHIPSSFGGRVSSFKSQKMEDWVNSLDWNYHEVGLIALCCNDHLVKAYNVRED